MVGWKPTIMSIISFCFLSICASCSLISSPHVKIWLNFYWKHWLLTIDQLRLQVLSDYCILHYVAFTSTDNAKGMEIFCISGKYSICSKIYNSGSVYQALCLWEVSLSNSDKGILGFYGPSNLASQNWLSVSSPQRKNARSVLFHLPFQESMHIFRSLSFLDAWHLWGKLYPETIWQDSNKSNECIYEKM